MQLEVCQEEKLKLQRVELRVGYSPDLSHVLPVITNVAFFRRLLSSRRRRQPISITVVFSITITTTLSSSSRNSPTLKPQPSSLLHRKKSREKPERARSRVAVQATKQRLHSTHLGPKLIRIIEVVEEFGGDHNAVAAHKAVSNRTVDCRMCNTRAVSERRCVEEKARTLTASSDAHSKS